QREAKSEALADIAGKTDPLTDIYELIDRAIAKDPPFSVREGGFIADGYNETVDKLRDIQKNVGSYINSMEATEREKLGMKGVKIGYNRVFGYYIEVPRALSDQVPKEYIRKQTLANCERYITDELKQLESTILSASERDAALEYELFREICQKLTEALPRIQQSGSRLAELDMYYSLAVAAVNYGYTRPEITCDEVIDIKSGRHPVVERFVSDAGFVPNDSNLNTGSRRLMIITGPNMAGKSTYMRQVALIVLMAQMGSFVPADDARIGIVDKLFTRIGASDDLASGQSTFMLEMNEVAYILKNATRRSLVIYDEIGRGTSTYDGMSIAKTVAEYTASSKIGAKTLFATHYHELTTIADAKKGIVNYHITAKKKGDTVVFLRKIIEGAADDSYGIEVAKLAGVPSEVIKRAKQVLLELEQGEGKVQIAKLKEEGDTISIEDYTAKMLMDKVKKLDPDTMTPMEAQMTLYELKKMLK
ncbi:MAG: DNA mismatch repair protein MutS, partial [Ruminococcaceae bacterium]|nr:DNA mismatch repair protein MutS [Oscillospiraceae bacterium]